MPKKNDFKLDVVSVKYIDIRSINSADPQL